jgi:hypothetical protein
MKASRAGEGVVGVLGAARLCDYDLTKMVDEYELSDQLQYQHDEGEVYLSQMTWGPSGAYQPVTTRRLKIEGRGVEDAVDLSEK